MTIKKFFSAFGKCISVFFCWIGHLLKTLCVFIGECICWFWSWMGKTILLFVKFFFWIWGAVLASILIFAIAFFLISYGIKAFDQTRFASFIATEMQMGFGVDEVIPELDLSAVDVDLEIIKE